MRTKHRHIGLTWSDLVPFIIKSESVLDILVKDYAVLFSALKLLYKMPSNTIQYIFEGSYVPTSVNWIFLVLVQLWQDTVPDSIFGWCKFNYLITD